MRQPMSLVFLLVISLLDPFTFQALVVVLLIGTKVQSDGAATCLVVYSCDTIAIKGIAGWGQRRRDGPALERNFLSLNIEKFIDSL